MDFLDNSALLITGCVFPDNKQRFLVLTDHKERYRQYIDSIKFYILNSDFKNIIFCDNSKCMYDKTSKLYELAEKNGKKFEWISFEGDSQKVVTVGKGYGEGEIIEYAINNSILLKTVASFAKVTGRLKISNIRKITQNVQCKKNYFNLDIYRAKGIDTRFYVCDIEFYNKYLMHAYKEASELKKDRVLEDVFYLILIANKKWKNLPDYPLFLGVSGGNGRDYTNESKIKLFVFSLLCRIGLFNSIFKLYRATIFRAIKKLQHICKTKH